MSLTPKQKQVLEYIKTYFQDHGYVPSKQEVANHFGFKSRGTVSDYIKRLKDLGLLDSQGRARSWAPQQTGNQLPLLGKVAAGVPLERYEHDQFLEVPSQFIKGKGGHYCLQVVGQSMVEEAILDGDYIVVRSQASASDGQIVVASIEGEATLKKFYKKGKRVELHPANKEFDPIIVKAPQNFQIEGILTAVLRQI